MTGAVDARMVQDAEDDPPAFLDVTPLAHRDARNTYFPDGRDGVDRWGFQRKDKTACGTGWDGYVCPLYVDESCPGERQPGTRLLASTMATCDLLCGACGGGHRDDTMNYCGHAKSAPFPEFAVAEMGTLRLDTYTAKPAPVPGTWPVTFFPSVEWGAKKWVPLLRQHSPDGLDWPMLATTMKTAAPGRRTSPTPIRARLGDYRGMLVVNGLTKDGHLDNLWDDRQRTMEFCKESGVDVMVSPQYSYYDDDAVMMWVYNTARSFRWYEECVELGFPISCLHCPPFGPKWWRDEWTSYIERNAVKCISFSFQTLSRLMPGHIQHARHLNATMPDDVAVIIFGSTSLQNATILRRCYEGRNLVFANVEAYAKAIFFKLVTETKAPPGWTKGDAFAWSVAHYAKLLDRVVSSATASSDDEAPPARRGRSRRSGARGRAGSAPPRTARRARRRG